MSWIYALISHEQGADVLHGSEDIHAKPLFTVRSRSMYVAAGGIPETCLFETDESDPENGWVVVGLGIEVSDAPARCMDRNAWRRALSKDTPWCDSLNGHFAAIRWRNGRVELFTDELGQRTFYFGKYTSGICVSTRVDWVSRTTGYTEIDFSSFGSKWLTFNQLDYSSGIVGIERLGPRGHGLFENGNALKIETTPWMPEFANGRIDRAVNVLMFILRGGMGQTRQVSLGLSGGIDSRLILACLMSIDGHRFSVHTFGNPRDPDVIVSSSIAENLRLSREFFDEPLPDVSTTVALLKEYAAQA